MEFTNNYNNHLATSNPPPTWQPFNIFLPTSVATGARPAGSRYSFSVGRLMLMLMLVMVFLILCLIVFIAWLVIHPHDPAIRLNSLSLSNITVSNPKFAANYDIEFTVNNTNNKVNLCIDLEEVTVYYGLDPISSQVSEKSWYAGKRSQAKLSAELGRGSVLLVKDGVFKNISDDWSKKMLNFNVKMLIRAGFETGILPTKQRVMEVRCMSLPVEFVSTKGTGKLMGGGKDCLVHA